MNIRNFVATGLAVFAALWVFGHCSACSSEPSAAAVQKSVDYGALLEACTAMSATCEASIECENKLRVANGRPLRDVKAGCK